MELRPGNGSLNLAAESRGDKEPEVGVRTRGAPTEDPNETWWSGEAGRLLLDSEPVLLYRLESGEGCNAPGLGVSSSSASSEISHTLGAPLCAYESSWRNDWLRGLRVRLGERSGDDGRAGTGEGDKAR